MANTAYTGTRCLETRRQSWWPGTAPSRENANIIREADVVDAVRQKNCATTQMASSASDQFSLIEVCPDLGHDRPDVVERPLGARDRERHRDEQDEAEDHRDDDGHVHPDRGHS